MPIDEKLAAALNLCGFTTGERQESRLMNILGVILRLQEFPPVPLAFAEIYEQFLKENPSSRLTKAWVHRVLKTLVATQLIRVENPTAHRKKYIANVNTIVAGLEQLKGNTIENLETTNIEIDEELTKINALDCEHLSKELIKAVTGRQEEVSSRILRGVKELHRVLRYNMLDVAGEGDIIRATVLWLEPFVDDETGIRLMRFVEAAEKGTDVRFLVTTDMFRVEAERGIQGSVEDTIRLLTILVNMKEKGKKFDIRIYAGPHTYNQISFNDENMALVITENPVTATWMTRKFNPDLIDNAIKTFDNDWKKSKSFFELTQQEFDMFGVDYEELNRLMDSYEEEGSTKDSSQ
ncbi:MAG: hypothetical protein ACTSQZ_05110 [Candidatus Thorarchaeota archaeon]